MVPGLQKRQFRPEQEFSPAFHLGNTGENLKIWLAGFEPTTSTTPRKTALILNVDKQTTYDDEGEPLQEMLQGLRVLMQTESGLLDLTDLLRTALTERQRVALSKLLR